MANQPSASKAFSHSFKEAGAHATEHFNFGFARLPHPAKNNKRTEMNETKEQSDRLK